MCQPRYQQWQCYGSWKEHFIQLDEILFYYVQGGSISMQLKSCTECVWLFPTLAWWQEHVRIHAISILTFTIKHVVGIHVSLHMWNLNTTQLPTMCWSMPYSKAQIIRLSIHFGKIKSHKTLLVKHQIFDPP